jgi:putative oxidoreductase
MWRVFPEFAGGPRGVALLLLRLAMGVAFLFHGWPKIQNPMGWMPEGAPIPGVLQAAAAVAEFGGGLALILGLLTPLAALGLAATMLVAALMVHVPMGHPFVASKPGEPSSELAVVYLSISTALLLLGPGKLSLDWLLFGRRAAPRPTP